MPWGCLRFVIVVFPDHTHLLFLITIEGSHIQHIQHNSGFGFSSLAKDGDAFRSQYLVFKGKLNKI